MEISSFSSYVDVDVVVDIDRIQSLDRCKFFHGK